MPIRTPSWIFLLACGLGAASAASTSSVGAGGSYEVYVGSAFFTKELVDSSKWSYVAGKSDGIYWHPVGYHQTEGYDNATPSEWRQIASYFHGKGAVVEGDMINGKSTGDLGTIKLVKSLGFSPTVALVNRITDDSGSWKERVALNLAQGVESYTMIAPHRMEALKGGFADPSYDDKRRLILEGYGTSVDAPTQLFIHHSSKYRQSIYDAIAWAHKNNRKFCYLISPNTSADSFLIHAQILTRMLEDSLRIPDQFAVELYGRRPYTLTPETVAGKSGKPVSANTITGVAHWLLKHARADGQELDLWIVGPDGKSIGKGSVSEDSTHPAPIGMKAWKGSNGSFKFTVQIQNKSDWLDFIPSLNAKITGLPSGWTARFDSDGKDVSNAVKSTGFVFFQKDRFWPGDTKSVTVTLAKVGASALPTTVGIDLRLLPHPDSRFVRDMARLRYDATSSVLEQIPSFKAPSIRSVPGGIALENTGKFALPVRVLDLSGRTLYRGEVAPGPSLISLPSSQGRVVTVQTGSDLGMASQRVFVPR